MTQTENEKRRRKPRKFPPSTLEDALELGEAVFKAGAGQPVRRTTLLESLERSPSSSTTREWITNGNQYGIITGGYNAEHLELTDTGKLAVDPDAAPADQLRARFTLGLEGIAPFKTAYEKFLESRLPDPRVLEDTFKEAGVDSSRLTECVDTFIVNLKALGLLRSIGGAERLVSLSHVLDLEKDEIVAERDEAPAVPTPSTDPSPETAVPSGPRTPSNRQSTENLTSTCFFIAPIGTDGSEERQHSDLVMGSLLEPALEEFGLDLVRADAIAEPGMITSQVIRYLIQAPLVVADLTFHNPNVFYELALRHAVKRPVVQIIRSSDKIPFDIQPFRTVVLDMTDIYSFVPKIETYRAEVSSQIRSALQQSTSQNPLSLFYPGFWSEIDS